MNQENNWNENRKMVLYEIKRLQELLDKLCERIDKHGDAIVAKRVEQEFMSEKISELSKQLDELTDKYSATANDVNSLKTKAYIFATLAAIGVTAAVEIISAFIGR